MINPESILSAAKDNERSVAKFLRDLIAIKSVSSREEEVISRIREEMERCAFDDVTIDPMGNILGRIAMATASLRSTLMSIRSMSETPGTGPSTPSGAPRKKVSSTAAAPAI